jgi:hypothetical protein
LNSIEKLIKVYQDHKVNLKLPKYLSWETIKNAREAKFIKGKTASETIKAFNNEAEYFIQKFLRKMTKEEFDQNATKLKSLTKIYKDHGAKIK